MRTWTEREDTMLIAIHGDTITAREALTDEHGTSSRYWTIVSHYILKEGAERTGEACRKRYSVLTAPVVEETIYPAMFLGSAIAAMRTGRRVCRRGWNGKGQFVALMTGLHLSPNDGSRGLPKVNDATARLVGSTMGLETKPYFALLNAQGEWQLGWVPSTGDCLADDWEVVE